MIKYFLIIKRIQYELQDIRMHSDLSTNMCLAVVVTCARLKLLYFLKLLYSFRY